MPIRIIHKDLSYQIVGVLFDVYNELGEGHKEKYYENAVAHAFNELKTPYQRQASHPLKYKDKKVGQYYLDFVVDNKIVLELKRGNKFSKRHVDQVLEYLQVTGLELAILATFTNDGVKFMRLLNDKNHQNT